MWLIWGFKVLNSLREMKYQSKDYPVEKMFEYFRENFYKIVNHIEG